EHCSSPSVTSDSDDDDTSTTSTSSDSGQSKCKVKNCFLKDISSSTSPYVTNFQQYKQELTQSLLKLYNKTVFNDKLSNSIYVTWSNLLRTAAGHCIHTVKNDKPFSIIEISDKVCDSADRLRDALLHEMCHAACWIIQSERKDRHGSIWQSYGMLATRIHPELPLVRKKHNFVINYPYSYVCLQCGKREGRYRPIRDKAFCRKCWGPLVTPTMDTPSRS
ncbi:Acidic repeat containing, partial [Pristimantis euphronides]